MRLFLAIELEASVRDGLARVRSALERTGVDARWSSPESLHLTVLFLGELDAAALPGVEEACAAVASETSPFRFRVRGASGFPKRGPLKTLWMGLDEGAEEWAALVRRAEPWFVPMGVARNGGLVPHVTLGRVRSGGDDPSLRAALEALGREEAGAQSARGLTLVRSVLDRSGATYQNLGFHPFEGTAADPHRGPVP